ncbi:hypothetical protein [Variovorax sp. PAMC 28711]|uniref:hypothetical protein n=1 Tax=Variovorax sp. PAMC 28711 TaxID=1795631 RepID=UPI00078EF2C6|nr:hypothetical protein [Variovorax sp. PAMC 28711]AMM25722.1 hypothetical protein AX767_16165 [Variovorax sp. PAMC 28711]
MIAGASVSIITAGLALSAAGATGTLAAGVIAAGGVLSFIPVFGWIVIVVGFIAAGIYMAYKASTEEDTPLEKWLSRCYYRNEAKYKGTTRKPFADLKEELSEFQLAIYGLSISFTWSDGYLGKDTLEIQVVMPGYSARNSDYAFYLSVSGPKWKNTVIDRQSSTFSTDVDLQPQPPQQTYVSASTGNSIPAEEVLEITQGIKLDVSGGTGTLSGIYRINDQYFTKAKLKFEYRPDVIDKPELLMIPVPGGSNFVQTGD